MARRFAIDKGRMLPHQRAFLELPNFVKLLVGGYGCGKTHIGALRLWRVLFSSWVDWWHGHKRRAGGGCCFV